MLDVLWSLLQSLVREAMAKGVHLGFLLSSMSGSS